MGTLFLTLTIVNFAITRMLIAVKQERMDQLNNDGVTRVHWRNIQQHKANGKLIFDSQLVIRNIT